MRWLRKRWYAYMPAIVAGLGLVLPQGCFLLVALLPLSHQTGLTLLNRLTLPLLIVMVTSMCFFTLWQAWMVPWLDSANPALVMHKTPELCWRQIRGLIWMPVLLCLTGTLLISVALPLFEGFAYGTWQWGAASAWGLLGLVLGLVLSPWTLWLSRAVERRFHRMVAQRQICFQCGYDLRGNPQGARCPECGETVPDAVRTAPPAARRGRAAQPVD